MGDLCMSEKSPFEIISDEFLYLNSCGIEKLWDGDRFQIRENGRIDYHILYIVQGKCTIEINDRETVINAGDLVLFPPGVKQKYSFKAADYPISYYLHFSGKECERILEEIGFYPECIIRLSKSSTLEAVFEKMCHEYHMKKPFYERLCAAYLLEFFEIIGRRLHEKENFAHVKNKDEIDNVCKNMVSEYMKSYPVSHYASLCHMSVGRFHHIFKACTGQTPVEYLNSIRINMAKDYLINTDIPISQISYLVGFSEQNYFSRAFKKSTGMSPRSFRMNW